MPPLPEATHSAWHEVNSKLVAQSTKEKGCRIVSACYPDFEILRPTVSCLLACCVRWLISPH
jgi:hypothetical protein